MRTQLTMPGDVVEPVDLLTVKGFLNVDHDDDDALIRLLISAARVSAESITGRIIAPRDFQIDLADFNNGFLPISPVVSVASVKYLRGGVLQNIADCSLFPHPFSPEIVPALAWPVDIDKARNAVQIKLRAGMVPVPENIITWILMRVSTTYAMRIAVVDGRVIELPRSFVDGLLDDYLDYAR